MENDPPNQGPGRFIGLTPPTVSAAANDDSPRHTCITKICRFTCCYSTIAIQGYYVPGAGGAMIIRFPLGT